MSDDDFPLPSGRRLCGGWLRGTNINHKDSVERRKPLAQPDADRRKDDPPRRGRLPRRRRAAPDPDGDAA